jgi:hypothetical protein
MKLHSESCSECKATFDFFSKIADIADLNAMEPPESWTSEAADQFDPDMATDESIVHGDLVFDSCIHDVEAVRSRRMEARHLVFDFPGFQIDLVLEYSGLQLDLIMGHILSKAPQLTKDLGRFGLELRLDTHFYSTTPNTLGEFIFKLQARTSGEPLELRCTTEEGLCAIVLIPC